MRYSIAFSLLGCCFVTLLGAQNQVERAPEFRDYPAKAMPPEKPMSPILESAEERKFQAVISDGVNKGWGVYDGITGKEQQRPGPNFAGHYILVSFGCGEPALTSCFSTAIMDAETGHVYRAPHPAPDSGFTLPYFGVFAERPGHYPALSFHNTQVSSPLQYRLDSRLLVAQVCERSILVGGSIVGPKAEGCGAHYYLMELDGLRLVFKSTE
jgi:hypothetical protein